MADYINLNELSITTQALLKKINEQADLKVDKDEVVQNTQSGEIIATVGDVDIYNGLDLEQLQYELGLASVAYSGSYNDLEDKPSFYPYVLYASPCNTPYGTAQKSVTVANFSPSQTCLLVVPFTAASTVDTPTLKINNSTTGSIYLGHSGVVNGTTNVLKWSADTTLVFLYDSNSTAFYFITAISRGAVDPARGANTWFGTSGSSADAVQKAAYCDNFVLTKGSLISIKFSNANTYAGQLSLNVNNTGSKVIHKGSITSTLNPLLWEANTTLTFMYTGNVYHYICSNVDIPTKVSDLTNDSGYQTESQVNTLIGTAIGGINQFNVAIVQTLPTTNIDAHTIYFVPQQNAQTANSYEEWMYINSQWEMIGTTSIDLSGYVPTSRTVNGKALSSDISLDYQDVGALPDSTTYVSSFNGSTGAVTYTAPVTDVQNESGMSLVASGVATIPDNDFIITYTATQNQETGYYELSYDKTYQEIRAAYDSKKDCYLVGPKFSTDNTMKSGSYNISSITTSETYRLPVAYVKTTRIYFGGFFTTYTNTGKTTIGFVRIGIGSSASAPYDVLLKQHCIMYDLPGVAGTAGQMLVLGETGNGLVWQDQPTIPGSTSDLTNDSGFITSADIPVTDVQDSSGNSLVSNGIATIPAIPTVPTNVSSFTNDAGYLTLATLPIYDGTVI